MYRLGYEYAQKLHADGKFDQYSLAEVLLSGNEGGLQVCEAGELEHSSG